VNGTEDYGYNNHGRLCRRGPPFGDKQYAYDAWNRRTWKIRTGGTQGRLHFYGPDGELLARYLVSETGYGRKLLGPEWWVYFAGRLVWKEDSVLAGDQELRSGPD
jgi:hypothetical protein